MQCLTMVVILGNLAVTAAMDGVRRQPQAPERHHQAASNGPAVSEDPVRRQKAASRSHVLTVFSGGKVAPAMPESTTSNSTRAEYYKTESKIVPCPDSDFLSSAWLCKKAVPYMGTDWKWDGSRRWGQNSTGSWSKVIALKGCLADDEHKQVNFNPLGAPADSTRFNDPLSGNHIPICKRANYGCQDWCYDANGMKIPWLVKCSLPGGCGSCNECNAHQVPDGYVMHLNHVCSDVLSNGSPGTPIEDVISHCNDDSTCGGFQYIQGTGHDDDGDWVGYWNTQEYLKTGPSCNYGRGVAFVKGTT